ncbi:hypothetical protein [Enterococcus cecorum]|uniref:hypothetical protein n=1 Tax=Enterococcus cecorum TaxID=44008 RepID=UPI00148B5FAC|nr:hypothetical protein [Enterococcus cecorum]
MQKKFKIKGTALALTDLRATLFIEGPTSLTTITFDKELLEAYAEDYIKEHFEISEDGWVRKVEEDGKETSL